MRKLLVASQKGGVGKTTTSINLAAATAMAGARVLLFDADPLSSISSSLNLPQHAKRQTLRQMGIDLPGVLVSDVVAGLDVLSPYEDGGCSDQELDSLITILSAPSLQERYGSLIVDTPPFMGANPGQLLSTSSEFVIVMRAEPLAYRTLPAFLELVQRSRGDAIALRGILLTLPEGEQPGGRWERELRGRFGTRILPRVIPHDEAMTQAILFGKIASYDNKDTPAAEAYHGLVETLRLAADARQRDEPILAQAALLQASKSVTIGAVRRGKSRPAITSLPLSEVASAKGNPNDRASPSNPLAESPFQAPIEPLAPSERPVSPSRRRTTPITAIPTNVDRVERGERSEQGERLKPSAPAKHVPTPKATATEPAAAEPEKAARKAKPPASQPENFPVGLGAWCIGIAILTGIGLRFVHLPDYAIPAIVGSGVAIAVVLILRQLQSQSAPRPPQAAPRKPPPRRSENRSDANKRLSGIKRRIGAPARNIHGD